MNEMCKAEDIFEEYKQKIKNLPNQPNRAIVVARYRKTVIVEITIARKKSVMARLRSVMSNGTFIFPV